MKYADNLWMKVRPHYRKRHMIYSSIKFRIYHEQNEIVWLLPLK